MSSFHLMGFKVLDKNGKVVFQQEDEKKVKTKKKGEKKREAGKGLI